MSKATLQKARGGLPFLSEMCVLSLTWRRAGSGGPVAGHSQSCIMGGKPWWVRKDGGKEVRRKAVSYGAVFWNMLTYCLIRKFGLSHGGWIHYNDLSVWRQQEKERFWKSIAFVYNLITGSLDKTSQKKKKAIATTDWLSVIILSASGGKPSVWGVRRPIVLRPECTKCDEHLPASPPVSGEEDSEMAVILVPRVLFCVWLCVFPDSEGSEHVQYAHMNVNLTSWERQT